MCSMFFNARINSEAFPGSSLYCGEFVVVNKLCFLISETLISVAKSVKDFEGFTLLVLAKEYTFNQMKFGENLGLFLGP